MAPSQDASDHQDYYIFSRGFQPKPSFATGILGGDNPHPRYAWNCWWERNNSHFWGYPIGRFFHWKTSRTTLPETNIAHENPIFPGKYHQNGGFSMAMLVYRRVFINSLCHCVAVLVVEFNLKKSNFKNHNDKRLIVKSNIGEKLWYSKKGPNSIFLGNPQDSLNVPSLKLTVPLWK